MTSGAEASSVSADAALAAALFAVDPTGLAGVVLRARHGPARDEWLAGLRASLGPETPVRRLPSQLEDGRLLGGLDLAATLAAGRPVAQSGVLAELDGGVAILPMAERLEPAMAAKLGGVIDQGAVTLERDGLARHLRARVGFILLDEGATPEERAPAALLERLAFHLELCEADEDGDEFIIPAMVAAAKGRLATLEAPGPAVVEAIVQVAADLAIPSLRASLLALRAAAAHAALRGRREVTADDAAVAARLVLAPRALAFPLHMDESEPEPPESEDQPPPDSADQDENQAAPMDRMIEAMRAALPDDLSARIAARSAERRAGLRSGDGGSAGSARRGRPVGSRGGPIRPGARLDLVETLRAAAPWQRLRASADGSARVQVRPDDFRFRRFVRRKPSTTIFVVDASGSTALQRLGEAKGAVELLLAKAYVSRARVALIGFRGTGADLLLPPTRSLTRAKRELAGLPGGGGTPLASGIELGLAVARGEAARGQTPFMVFLTDGRTNIGREGAPGRAAAEADALAAARQVAEARIVAAYLDTSARPQPDGDRFARAMGAVYAPLPQADARAVAALIGEAQTAA